MIADSLVARVLELAAAIQQIPAPTFAEQRRGAFVRDQFEAEGLQHITTDEIGNVFACLPGGGQSGPLVVSAHLDTVFPESTPLHLRREGDRIHGPGIGDNSLGVAGLFGLLWALKSGSTDRAGQPGLLPGDLWLVANVGEEGLGDLRGMRAVVDRFGDRALAYLVIEGMAFGHIYNRALGVQRYRISAHTAGGHSWVDYGCPSAIHELAGLITRLGALDLPEQPRCSLNVGVISGGISVNTIAPEARLELDLRSEGAPALEALVRRVQELVEGANRPGVQVSMELIGQRPAGEISERHPLVRLAKRCLRSQGIQPNLTIGSTDANIPLSRGLPAICLGLSSGHGAHTTDEYIHTAPLSSGLAQLVAVVEGAFHSQLRR